MKQIVQATMVVVKLLDGEQDMAMGDWDGLGRGWEPEEDRYLSKLRDMDGEFNLFRKYAFVHVRLFMQISWINM